MQNIDRNQLLGVRATRDFVRKFDELCDRLGHCRSDVIRYTLKKFLNETWNSSENFQRARRDMY